MGGKNIAIAVLDENGHAIADHFTIRLSGGTFDVIAHEKKDSEMDWTVKENYLKKVVENFHDYIEHPEKLEWEWLKSRMELGSC